jgi:hypothetical protein
MKHVHRFECQLSRLKDMLVDTADGAASRRLQGISGERLFLHYTSTVGV